MSPKNKSSTVYSSLASEPSFLRACVVLYANITLCGLQCAEYLGIMLNVWYMKRCARVTDQTTNHITTIHAQLYRLCGACSGSPQLCSVFVCTVFPRNLTAPRNLAAPIRRLVPINAALEISPHGKGSSDSKYAEC